METIIRKADHVVLYAGDNLTLSVDGLRGPGWIDPSLTSITATVQDLTLPEDWIPGAYAYNGAWTVADQSILDVVAVEKLVVLRRNIADLVCRIDADADAIYAAKLGNRTTEYADAEIAAIAYRAAGYTGTVPEDVQSWATSTGSPAQWAADDIIATADSWRAAQKVIRARRLNCKEPARKATTQAELDAIEAQWSAFVAQIRMQLGC